MSTPTVGPKHGGRVSNKKTSKTGSDVKTQKGNSRSQEEERIASLVNEKMDSADREVKVKVEKVMELTKASKDDAIVALHDSDYDVSRAVNKILEGDADESGWTTVSKQDKSKNKNNSTAKTTTESKAVNGNARNGTGNKGKKVEGSRPNRVPNQDGSRPPRAKKNDDEEDRRRPRKDGENKREPRPPGGARGRGTRTFSNQQRSLVPNTDGVTVAATESTLPPVPSSTDDFPNSIDTWSNTTADPNAKPTPTPITSMTVGNWSDVVSGANDDWSEEDHEINLTETKVFVPTGRPLPEVGEPRGNHMDDKHLSRQNFPPQEMRKEQAGAQLLQSLQPPSQPQMHRQQQPQMRPTQQQPLQQQQQQQGYSNKQAAESIKSLVGISTPQFAAGQGVRPDASKPSAPRVGQQRRSTRIPESAVEMPSVNDSVASLGVQFGALDVSNLGSDFASFKTDNSGSQMKPVAPQQQSHVQKQPLLPYQQHEQKAHPSEQSIRASNDLMKSLGAKPSESKQQPNVKSVMETQKGNDYYSGQQEAYKPPQSYGSAASNVYGNQFAYNNQAPYGQQQPQSSFSNYSGSKTSMKELDHTGSQSSSQNRQPSSYDLPSSTQTTNVLKNSLPATGQTKTPQMPNSSSRNIMNPQMQQQPQFMPPAGFYYAPAGVYDTMMAGHTSGQEANQFSGGYNPLGDNKFGRGPDTDVSGVGGTGSGPSSQNPVVSQAQQPMFGQPAGPPGYQGPFFYVPATPMVGPQGYFIPPASSAHVPPPSGFGKTNYGSGYPTSLYEGGGLNLQSDYGVKPGGNPYGQSSQQTQSKPLASGITADLMSGGPPSQSYKPHGSGQKMNYSTGNQGYNLAGSQPSYGNSYLVQPMNQGFQDTNQGQSRPGMTGNKTSSNPSKGGYGQNMYSSQW